MKRGTVITGLVILMMYLGAYLLAAFVLWEPHPAEWEMHVRFAVAILPASLAPIVAAAVAGKL